MFLSNFLKFYRVSPVFFYHGTGSQHKLIRDMTVIAKKINL